MSEGLRGLGRHAITYGLGTLAAKLVGFLMLPVYTRYLKPADYGVMELINITLDVITILAGGQIASGVFRYYHTSHSSEDRDALIGTAFIVVSGSYLAMGALTFLSAGILSELVFKGPDHAQLIRLAAVTMAASGALTTGLAFLRLQELSRLFVTVTLGRLILAAACNLVLLVLFRLGTTGVFIANVAATSTVAVVASGWLIRRVGWRFDRRYAARLMSYGWPLVLTNLATFFVAFGDRYFLQRSSGTADVGRYSLAYQFGFLLAAMGYAPFAGAWDTRRFALANSVDRDHLYSRAFLGMNLVLLTLAVAFALFAPEVLRFMTTAAYALHPGIVVLVLAAYVLQSWSGMHEIGILLAERTKFIAAANWAAAGVALVAYLALIPELGMLGAALATVAAFASRWAITYGIAQRLTPIRWRWGPVLRLSAIAAGACILAAFAPQNSFYESLALRTTILVAYLVGVWISGVLDAKDRATIAGGIRSPGALLSLLGR